MTQVFRSVLLSSVFVLAACGSAGNDASDATRSASPQDAPTDAVTMMRTGGTFAFALDESDPASSFREGCKQSQPSDPAACYAHIRDQGAKEKISLKLDGTRVVFSSFGPEDDGVETVWIEVALDLAADGTRFVLGTPNGSFKGAWAEKLASRPRTALRFEMVDATTIAMIDPKKGRLVYHKV
jgi:hypothetical protein